MDGAAAVRGAAERPGRRCAGGRRSRSRAVGRAAGWVAERGGEGVSCKTGLNSRGPGGVEGQGADLVWGAGRAAGRPLPQQSAAAERRVAMQHRQERTCSGRGAAHATALHEPRGRAGPEKNGVCGRAGRGAMQESHGPPHPSHRGPSLQWGRGATRSPRGVHNARTQCKRAARHADHVARRMLRGAEPRRTGRARNSYTCYRSGLAGPAHSMCTLPPDPPAASASTHHHHHQQCSL
eukprot:358636-Chlamydomonas_euryale.AAC.3